MTFADIMSFAFVASLLVMSPGPNGVLIAKTVPTSGRLAGFANIAGFVSAFFVHGTLSIIGISLILVQSATAFMVVKYLGAAYLCWIGVKALYGSYKGVTYAKSITAARRKRTLLYAYLEGLVTNILNPKVAMFYLAAFPQFISSGENALTPAYMLIILHSLLNIIWFAAMVLLLSRLSSLSRQGTFQRWLKAITGIAFIGFGLKLASVNRTM